LCLQAHLPAFTSSHSEGMQSLITGILVTAMQVASSSLQQH